MERFEQQDNLPMAEGEIDLRSQLASSLRGSAFPAQRNELLDLAQHENAHSDVLELVKSLPADRTFQNVQEVWESAGGRGDGEHTNTAYSGSAVDAFRGSGVGTEDPNIVGDAGAYDVAPGTDS